MPKIFISTVPFGKIDSQPLLLLKQNHIDFTTNPLGRKLLPSELADLAKSADGIIAGTEPVKELIECNSKLGIISRVGIGLDSVPLKRCQELGITVSYTPEAVTMAVAELVIGVMINLSRHAHIADRNTRKDMWNRLMGRRIENSTIGLIGFGRIGYQVARLLTPFNPKKILVNDIQDKQIEIDRLIKTGLKVSQVTKEKIYQKSDIISLHVPLTSETSNLINKVTLSIINPESFLLNYARGGIVHEHDLYDAIKKKQIAGAAIDTFVDEPYSGKLIELDNVLLTQHMGSCSYDCRHKMELEATEDLIRYFKGEPLKNEVPEVEYKYQ